MCVEFYTHVWGALRGQKRVPNPPRAIVTGGRSLLTEVGARDRIQFFARAGRAPPHWVIFPGPLHQYLWASCLFWISGQWQVFIFPPDFLSLRQPFFFATLLFKKDRNLVSNIKSPKTHRRENIFPSTFSSLLAQTIFITHFVFLVVTAWYIGVKVVE